MHITFQLRKSKINKKGLAPIKMRITIDGKRAELATHRTIRPELWNNYLGAAIGSNDETIILNNYLDALKSKVQRQFNILESLGSEVTVDAIKNTLLGQSEKKTHPVICLQLPQ